ncbi:MAG: putative acetolactate synthase isozyme large subunit [Pseudomonadota bacterium]|jgi:acetolactate synthase-1/2/3 large subunit
MSMTEPRSGGRILVDTLCALGVDTGFCVAGESYLEVLDAAVDRPELRLVPCRQEGGAAFMAEAWGKLTGKPGLCLVTRGPGACNAAIGIHTAFQDSTPMIVLVGQVGRDHRDREAFQEIDYRRMFGPVAKWVEEIDSAERIPEYLMRAWRIALSGRPGPVVLALPEDMLRERAVAVDPAAPPAIPAPHPDQAVLAEVSRRLAAAQRPIAIVGGSRWNEADRAALARFAADRALPIACAFRRQDILDNDHPCYVGDLGTGSNPALLDRVREADLLLVLGARLGEMTTQGYTLPVPPFPATPLVHVHVDGDELGRVYQPEISLQSTPGAFLAALSGGPVDAAGAERAEWLARLRAGYQAWQTPPDSTDALDLGACFAWLRDRLPADAIVTNDAGNFSGWGHRYLRWRAGGRQLAPTNGAMGYAVPAGVAASLAAPGRVVLSLVGDGGFLMTGQELATAMHTGATPVILVFDNGMYGTIRMHQEQRYPGRVSATDLTNPDFVALARAYGAFAARVERTADFAPALEAALDSETAAVIHLCMDPDVITTRTRLSAMRAKAAGSVR